MWMESRWRLACAWLRLPEREDVLSVLTEEISGLALRLECREACHLLGSIASTSDQLEFGSDAPASVDGLLVNRIEQSIVLYWDAAMRKARLLDGSRTRVPVQNETRDWTDDLLEREWIETRQLVKAHDALYSHRLPRTDCLPRRVARIVDGLEQPVLGSLLALDFADLLATRNIGRGSIRGILNVARRLIRNSAHEVDANDSPGESSGSLDRTADAPASCDEEQDQYSEFAWRIGDWAGALLLPIEVCPISARAMNYLVKKHGCLYLGDALCALLQNVTIGRAPGVGRSTRLELDALRGMRDWDDETVLAWMVNPVAPAGGFIGTIDGWIASLSAIDRFLVFGRICEGETLEEVATRAGVSRERIRQRMPAIRRYVRRALVAYRLDLGAILADGCLEMDELGPCAVACEHPDHVYIRLVRCALAAEDSGETVDAFYDAQLTRLSDELKARDEWCIGEMTMATVSNVIDVGYRGLRELTTNEIVAELPHRIGGRWLPDGRLVPNSFQTKNALRALVRRSSSPRSLDDVSLLLEAAADRCGSGLTFTSARVRAIVRGAGDLWLREGGGVTAKPMEPAVVDAWLAQFWSYVAAQGRPVSLSSFLAEYPEAPFDVHTLGEALEASGEGVRIGRHLYASEQYGRKEALQVSSLLSDALADARRPCTVEELLAYVDARRDLRTRQIEPYLAKVPGIVRHGRYAYGLEELTRDGKLSLIVNESFVRIRFRDWKRIGHVALSDFWPRECGDPPSLTFLERCQCVREAELWQAFRLVDQEGLHFARASYLMGRIRRDPTLPLSNLQ